MAFQDCIDEIQRAVGRDLTDDELERVSEDVERIIRKYNVDGRLDTAQEAVKRTADELEIEAILRERNAALNKIAQRNIVKYVMDSYADEPGVGFESVLSGVFKGARRGARESVGSRYRSIKAQHAMGLIAELEQRGLSRGFTRGLYDKDVYKAMKQLDEGEPNFTGINPDAIEIAKVIQKYNENMRLLANRWGANIKKLPGYVIRRTHDTAKIYRKKEAWLAFMEKELDWDRSFPEVVDADERLRILNNLWRDFSSGVHLAPASEKMRSQAADSTPPLKGIANIGRKMSHERVLHFKKAEAEHAYNTEFGAGTLTEGVMYGIDRMARDIAIMQKLGPNAEMNLMAAQEAILRRVEKESPGDPDKIRRAQNKMDRVMRVLWPHVNGAANIPGNNILAQRSAVVRALQTLASLGGVVLSAISDIPIQASQVRYQGGTMLGGIGEALVGLTRRVAPEHRARVASMTGVYAEGMAGSYTSRWTADDDLPGRMSSLMTAFFKLNLQTWWTESLRHSYVAARAHDLGLLAGRSFGDLDPDLRRSMALFDLGEAEWDVIRQNPVVADGDDKVMLTGESVDGLSDDAIRAYLEGQGRRATQRAIAQERDALATKFRSYFSDPASTAILQPDEKTNSYMFQGTTPGTPLGEFLRFAMQFKSFTTSVIQKPLAREIYGRGAMSVKEAMRNGNGEVLGLANLIAWNAAFGYIAMSAKDLAKGREPRDADDYNTWVAALAQGGGMGIYGDFLFGDMKNRFGGGAVLTLAGPTAGDLNSLFDIYNRMRDGDDAAAQSFRFVLNNTPFVNLFYTRAALDYLVLYQMSEHMSPGYLRRMERRIEEENGQQFLAPPSQAIPTGGGDRIFEGVR